jgi:hypothetical protein
MKRYIKSDSFPNLRKYSGTIYKGDLDSYGEELGLPRGEVKMVKTGEWVGGGRRPIGSYQFADGSFSYDDPNAEYILQFTYDRKTKTFYLETIDTI